MIYTAVASSGIVETTTRDRYEQTYQRTSPESQWVITERPELRIVSEELSDRVQTRTRETAANYPGMKPGLLHRAATAPYLFSGILKCSAKLAILTGRGKEGKRASRTVPNTSIAAHAPTTCISAAISWNVPYSLDFNTPYWRTLHLVWWFPGSQRLCAQFYQGRPELFVS